MACNLALSWKMKVNSTRLTTKLLKLNMNIFIIFFLSAFS